MPIIHCFILKSRTKSNTRRGQRRQIRLFVGVIAECHARRLPNSYTREVKASAKKAREREVAALANGYLANLPASRQRQLRAHAGPAVLLHKVVRADGRACRPRCGGRTYCPLAHGSTPHRGFNIPTYAMPCARELCRPARRYMQSQWRGVVMMQVQR